MVVGQVEAAVQVLRWRVRGRGIRGRKAGHSELMIQSHESSQKIPREILRDETLIISMVISIIEVYHKPQLLIKSSNSYLVIPSQAGQLRGHVLVPALRHRCVLGLRNSRIFHLLSQLHLMQAIINIRILSRIESIDIPRGELISVISLQIRSCWVNSLASQKCSGSLCWSSTWVGLTLILVISNSAVFSLGRRGIWQNSLVNRARWLNNENESQPNH